MIEIEALEQRITAALDRIGRGMAALETPGPAIAPPFFEAAPARADPAEAERIAALERALEDERIANGQLEERVRVLKERQDGRVAELEAQVRAQAGRYGAIDAELQRLRQSHADLREVTARLRAAVAAETGSPELVNRAMLAELDALRAARAADRAEIDAVMAELKPLIAETI